MPSIPKEVQDVARGINVTIVDLIGALLPGLVWFVLLATVGSLASAPEGASPLQTIHEVLQYGSMSGTAFYVAVVLVAILLGWVIKASGLDWADRICACSIWLAYQSRHLIWVAVRPAGWDESAENARKDTNIADLLFPYDKIVNNENSQVFEALNVFATANLGHLSKVPGRHPFETCKLLLRQSDPLCREEAERAEAQVALLGSLFLASLFSLVSAVVAKALRPNSPWEWMAASAAAVAFLGYSFRRDRRAEVDRTYLMALLIAERGREKEVERAHAMAAGGAVRRSH